jgi:hypothetical protein
VREVVLLGEVLRLRVGQRRGGRRGRGERVGRGGVENLRAGTTKNKRTEREEEEEEEDRVSLLGSIPIVGRKEV